MAPLLLTRSNCRYVCLRVRTCECARVMVCNHILFGVFIYISLHMFQYSGYFVCIIYNLFIFIFDFNINLYSRVFVKGLCGAAVDCAACARGERIDLLRDRSAAACGYSRWHQAATKVCAHRGRQHALNRVFSHSHSHPLKHTCTCILYDISCETALLQPEVIPAAPYSYQSICTQGQTHTHAHLAEHLLLRSQNIYFA